jgi:hypothetical protein
MEAFFFKKTSTSVSGHFSFSFVLLGFNFCILSLCKLAQYSGEFIINPAHDSSYLTCKLRLPIYMYYVPTSLSKIRAAY